MTIENARLLLNNFGRFRIIDTASGKVEGEGSGADILNHLDCCSAFTK
jgi:hypothetical protein